MSKEVRFPDGTLVRAAAITDRTVNRDWREFGLYADERWHPNWSASIIEWDDFGIPSDPENAFDQITAAFHRAKQGTRVEVGCAGGTGRTGTILACMAVLAGVPASVAVTWVREHYSIYAVETEAQEAWVTWFAERLSRPPPLDDLPTLRDHGTGSPRTGGTDAI